MGDVEGAIRQWRTAAEIDSKAALPQLLVAAAHYAKDDRPGGLAMADAALELDRDYANLAVLKKNLWSDRLLTDTQKLLTYFTPIKILTGHSESKITEKDIKSIVISPDGQTLANGGADGTIKLRTGKMPIPLKRHFFWWGRRPACLRSQYFRVKVLDLRRSQQNNEGVRKYPQTLL